MAAEAAGLIVELSAEVSAMLAPHLVNDQRAETLVNLIVVEWIEAHQTDPVDLMSEDELIEQIASQTGRSIEKVTAYLKFQQQRSMLPRLREQAWITCKNLRVFKGRTATMIDETL